MTTEDNQKENKQTAPEYEETGKVLEYQPGENEKKEQESRGEDSLPTIKDTSEPRQNKGGVVEVDDHPTENENEYLKPLNYATGQEGEEGQHKGTDERSSRENEAGEKVQEDDNTEKETGLEEKSDTSHQNKKSDEERKEEEEVEEIFANDYLKRLNALVKQKGEGVLKDPNFGFFQEFDVDKVDLSDHNTALELVKRKIGIENPDLNQSEIEEEVKEKYENLLSGDYSSDDEEYIRAKRKLKIEGSQAKNFLAEKSKDYKLPELDEIDTPSAQVRKLTPDQKQAMDKAEKTYKDGVSTFAEGLSKEGFKISGIKEHTKGAVEELSFKPSEDAVKRTKEYLENGRNDTFFNQFVEKDETTGKVTGVRADQMAEAITWVTDKDKIVKTLVDQGISIGREQADREYDNTTLGNSPSKGNSSGRPAPRSEKSQLHDIAQQMQNNQKSKKEYEPWQDR